MFRADLHVHTTCSDGTYSPLEVLRLAKKLSLSAISVTDHDTIDAYATLIPEAKALGILLGTGVEFSCMHEGISVHVLGYDYSLEDAGLQAWCLKHKERRQLRNQHIIAKLSRRGMPIEIPEGLGRPHIAAEMVKKGYVKTIKEAFNLYIGEGKSCYDAGPLFSIQDTLDVIHHAGGKAFLAHPHLMSPSSKVKGLLDLGFDGIECYYAKCAPDQEKKWLKIAKEKKLLISGGSDFHGDIKPGLALGSSWVDEPSFQLIFQHCL